MIESLKSDKINRQLLMTNMEGREMSMDDYLSKPVDITALGQAVARAAVSRDIQATG